MLRGGFMAERIVSPDVCVFSDENRETLNIQIELPGVDKNNIDLQFYEDGFYVVAKGENTRYMGSYSIIFPVQPEKAIANYSNGLLTINIPFKKPFQPGVKVRIE
jgi:HSP20 family molecular chaperone IbpA